MYDSAKILIGKRKIIKQKSNMLKLKDAHRLQKLFWMSPRDLLSYLSSEASDNQDEDFFINYGFTIKEAIESLSELKKIINK